MITGPHGADSSNGMKMVGLLQLDATLLEVRFSIGIRNAHAKSMPLGLVAGYNVFVCENMSFSGHFKPVLAKHSKHFNLEDALAIGIDRIQKGWKPMQAELEHRRSFEITDDQARLMIYQGFLRGKIPNQVDEACRPGVLQSLIRGIQAEDPLVFRKRFYHRL